MSTRTSVDPKTLPDDPAILRTLIVELQARIEHLTQIVLQLRRHQFGPKSERLSEGQEIFPFYGTLAPEPLRAGSEPDVPPASKTNGHGRRVIPADLPRRRIVHDVPEEEKFCRQCREPLREIGQETAEQLEYHPASLHVLEHVRLKYACRKCQENVVVAEPATAPIAKGLAGPGLLSQVVVSKYADHLPLYRQSEIFRRQGVELSRSTLCGWVGESVELLRPIVKAMRGDVLESKVVQTDDTPVRVLEPGRGKTREGRLWAYVGDQEHRQVVYEFTLTREQKWAREFLKDFHGHLQADAYKGYDQLFVGGKRIEVGCWAHTRRKFFEAKETDPERAAQALHLIGKLYQIEEEAKEFSSCERARLRQERAQPMLEEFSRWLERELLKLLPRSPMGHAIQYARAQWEALLRYLEDGDLSIDNNACERALRGVCLGRKNYLFFGGEGGGHWAAVIYSLVESCKLNGKDPFAYVRDVLVRVCTTPMSRVLDLTPRLWQPAPKAEDTS